MLVRLSSILCVLITLGTALRKRRGSHKVGSVGTVDSLWAYGGPEVGKSAPLTSFGGCFKGQRVVITDGEGSKKGVDLVSVVARKVGYYPAEMNLVEVEKQSRTRKDATCSSDLMREPQGRGKMELHDIPLYYELLKVTGEDSRQLDYAHFALFTAAVKDKADARIDVQNRGWQLVGTANHEGGVILGGPQVAHLIQHPSTLDCVLTFQYTMTRADWWNNLAIVSKSFCGRAEKVHGGLANALKLTVNSTEWQANIRPNLKYCAKVISVGHSQGAAQAELFAACVNQNPNNDGSYNSIKWTRATPKRLPGV